MWWTGNWDIKTVSRKTAGKEKKNGSVGVDAEKAQYSKIYR
jgi:hypothetical protein